MHLQKINERDEADNARYICNIFLRVRYHQKSTRDMFAVQLTDRLRRFFATTKAFLLITIKFKEQYIKQWPSFYYYYQQDKDSKRVKYIEMKGNNIDNISIS